MQERTPLHQFIRKSLYEDLTPTTTEDILKRLRKLPWDKSCFMIVLKALANVPRTRVACFQCGIAIDPHRVLCTWPNLVAACQVGNVKFGNIPELASVASGLNKYHAIGVPLVDAILEEIRAGLEMNEPAQRQRRIANIKYLGELYTYQLFQAQVIFDTLYLLITFGRDGQVLVLLLDFGW